MNSAGQAPEEEIDAQPGQHMANATEAPVEQRSVLPARPDGHVLSQPGAPASVERPVPWIPGSSQAASSQYTEDGKGAVPERVLPAVEPGADLARVRMPWYWLALCFVLTWAVYTAFVPRFVLFSSPPTGDQVYYMLDTISLVQDHDLLLNNNYQNQDWRLFYDKAPHPPGFVGMGAPDPLSPMLANASARPPEEQYSFHLPGLPVWLIPAWVIGGVFSLWWPACVVFMGLLGALMALNIFLFANELTGRRWIAWTVWAAVAFSGPLMSYSYLVFTELPVGLLLIYVFRRIALGWAANGPFRILLLGLCIANIPWLAWRCAPIAGFLGLYALVQWWRYRRVMRSTSVESQETAPARKQALNNGSLGWVALFLVPPVVLGALLLYYNVYLFGRIVPDSSVLEQGRVAIFHYPWQSVEDARSFVSAIFGQLFDRGFGLLPYAPIYVLAFAGVIAAFRVRGPYRRLILWMGLISLPYLFVICSFDSWDGVWCPPARYLTTFVPFMAGLLAISLFAFRRSVVYKLLYFLLAIPGWVLMLAMLDDARLFWPLTQGGAFLKLTEYPFSPVKIDLSQFLPIFLPVDDTTHPVNTGWITIAAVAIVLLCYVLMQFQRRLREDAPHRIAYPAQGAFWGATLLVIGLGWYFMNYDYIKHRTEFVETHRWTIPVLLDEPYGVAYDNGKVYVSSFARNSQAIVGVFTPATQEFALLQPVSNTVGTQFAHIGDIRPGPDGNLYVLNNGSLTDAMWVMTPDGQIVKGMGLDRKTPLATGFNFGPDGNIFVADMLGGRILKFPPSGGEPLDVFGGMTGGFNNPAGVAVTPDGMIYAAEQGFQRLQQLGPDGHFIRNFDLHCKPTHVTVSGDFLDVSCDRGLISVNWKKGEVQLAHYDSVEHKPNNPTGLTYGPDNTLLYVIDGNVLIEYKVTH